MHNNKPLFIMLYFYLSSRTNNDSNNLYFILIVVSFLVSMKYSLTIHDKDVMMRFGDFGCYSQR